MIIQTYNNCDPLKKNSRALRFENWGANSTIREIPEYSGKYMVVIHQIKVYYSSSSTLAIVIVLFTSSLSSLCVCLLQNPIVS